MQLQETQMESDQSISFDDFFKYSKKMSEIFIQRKFFYKPQEVKEEMLQEVSLKAWIAYSQRLNPEKLSNPNSWKAFAYKTAIGAIKDYDKKGLGFEEDVSKFREDSKKIYMIRPNSSSVCDNSDSPVRMEDILDSYGFVCSIKPRDQQIQWDLASRLASKDCSLHIVLKISIGFSVDEIAKIFSITRQRVYQIKQEFFENLKKKKKHDTQRAQTIYSLGLSEFYGLRSSDNGYGWWFHPINIFEGKKETSSNQLSFGI